MGKNILAFFDWRVGISRIQYFRGSVIRAFIVFGIVLLNFFFSYLFGWDVGLGLADNGDSIWLYMEDPLVATSSFIIFLPWDLRRMKDAGINWWWIVLFETLIRLPEPPAIDGAEFLHHNVAYIILALIPYLIFCLILIFKPGKIYRDFVSNGSARRGGSSKVTFSG